MNMVYILECSDSTYYTGWTNNLEKRLQAHNNGTGAKYTRHRLPVKCVYQMEFNDSRLAQSREYHIKQMSRLEKKQLIDEYSTLIELAKSKCRQFNLYPDKITLIRVKNEIVLFRLVINDKHKVLKIFLSENQRQEIKIYKLFEKYHQKSLPLLFCDENSLIIEDLDYSKQYRKATKEDMNNKKSMSSLASWYQRLHQLDISEFKLSNEIDCFFQLYDTHPIIHKFLTQVRKQELCVCYNDFYYQNMAIDLSNNEAFMFDYGKVGLNFPCLDLTNALWFSDDDVKKEFIENYNGLVSTDLVELMLRYQKEAPNFSEELILDIKKHFEHSK